MATMRTMINRALLTGSLCLVLLHSRAGGERQAIVRTDTLLQLLMDDYSRAMADKKMCSRKLDTLNNVLTGNKKAQESLAKEKKAWEHLKDSTAKVKPAGTVKKDSVLILVKLYDSLSGDNGKKIAALEKEFKATEKEIAKYSGESGEYEKAMESLLKKIRELTRTISGARSVTLDNKKYQLFVADMALYEVRLHLFNKKNGKNYFTFGAVLHVLQAEKKEAQMITNAGMFTPLHEPEGLYIEEQGKRSFPVDTGSSVSAANFYLKPNGVFFIDSADNFGVQQTEEFLLRKKNGLPNVKMATQSGPMLVVNGEIHPAFKPASGNLNIRSGVGLITNKKVVFVIGVSEVNFYEFASFFKDLFDCKNALYLDGAISQMYLRDIAPGVTGGNFGPIISVSKK